MNIFALSTGKRPSGIAILRLSGKDSLRISKLKTKKQKTSPRKQKEEARAKHKQKANATAQAIGKCKKQKQKCELHFVLVKHRNRVMDVRHHRPVELHICFQRFEYLLVDH